MNTVDSMTEKEVLIGLINGTLQNFEDDRLKTIERGGFYGNTGIITIKLPNLTVLNDTQLFSECTNLTEVEFGKLISTRLDEFQNCHNLERVILRNSTVPENVAITDFYYKSGIASLKGGVYVPRSLLNSYRAIIKSQNTDCKYLLAYYHAIEDMPLTDFSTISMTWAQIKAGIEDGSFFSSDYAIGDIKSFTYNNTLVYAQIARMDSTNNYVDFILRNYAEKTYVGNMGLASAYSDSTAKARLDEIWTNELETDLKNIITPVTRTYTKPNNAGNDILTVPLWIPISYEIHAVGGSSIFPLFNHTSSKGRIMTMIRNSSDNNSQWLNGDSNVTNFTFTTSNGQNAAGTYPQTSPPSPQYGLVFCFRIQKES